MIGAARWDNWSLHECRPPDGRAAVWCHICGAVDRLILSGSRFTCATPVICARNLERSR